MNKYCGFGFKSNNFNVYNKTLIVINNKYYSIIPKVSIFDSFILFAYLENLKIYLKLSQRVFYQLLSLRGVNIKLAQSRHSYNLLYNVYNMYTYTVLL